MATVALSTTPATLDPGTAYELFVVNSGATNVRVQITTTAAGVLFDHKLKPGQSAHVPTGGNPVMGVTESGSGQVDVTTSANPEGGGGGGGGSAAYAPISATWVTGAVYKTGELVTNGTSLYKAVDNHTAGSTFAGDSAHWTAVGGGGGTAATTTFTPAGNIAATDVQAALAELDSEKAPLATLQTKTANYTLTTSDSVVLFNGSSLTATLPSAATAGATGKPYTVKNLHSSTLTLGSTAGTIDGATSQTLAQNVSYTVVSDGTNWLVV